MTQMITQALLGSYQRTIGLLGDTIRNFDEASWRKGLADFQMPAKVAYHTVEALDFFFRPKGTDFIFGQRFGTPWWELPDREQPSQEDLLVYLNDMAARIDAHFAALQDEALDELYDPQSDESRTAIEHYLYALRHTVHHHGALAALADIHSVPSGDWDTWA